MAKQKTLKERREEAEILTNKIDAELLKVRANVRSIINELTDATKTKNELQKLVPKIKEISKNANGAIQKLRTDRDNIKRLLGTVNTFYTDKYLPLVDHITDPELGLKARIKEVNRISKEFKIIEENSKTQYKHIQDLTKDFRKQLSELKSIDVKLRNISKFIQKSETEVIRSKGNIDLLLVEVQESSKRIASAEDTVKQKELEINRIHDESNKVFNEINNWHSDASEILQKIKKIYDVAAGTGLGGEFDKRRNGLTTELDRWRAYILRTTIILLVVILSLFVLQLIPVHWDITKLKFDANFYIRFLITSPLIFYLVFVTNQFNNTKKLLERYSFKTAIALSIEAHINLLTNVPAFSDKDSLNKIVDFFIDGFDKIYDAPYQIHSSRQTSKVDKPSKNKSDM